MKKLSKFLRPIVFAILGAALVSCGTNGFMGIDLDGTNMSDLHKRGVSANQGRLPYVVTAQGMARLYSAGDPTLFLCQDNGGDNWRRKSHPHEGPNPREAVQKRATVADSSLEDAKQRAINECTNFSYTGVYLEPEACMVTFINEQNVCATEFASFRRNLPQINSNYQRQYAQQGQESRRQAAQAQQQRRQQATKELNATCRSFGFTDGTPEMANCLLELYKIGNQPQQNTVITNSAPARNNSSDLNSSIELMNRGLQILNGVGAPSAPSSRTSTCTRIGDLTGQVVTFNSIACPAGYAPTF